jgi:hypothetical protein
VIAERPPGNVILTGVPRSGTTLTCHLLNKVPNTIALHEPMQVEGLADLPGFDAAADAIQAFFASSRASLLARRTAISKHAGGRVPDDQFETAPADRVVRRRIGTKGEITFAKDLDADFTLVIKHPAAFTAMIGTLHQRFPMFALIRNPLSVLGSWNSVDTDLRLARDTVAERFDPELRAALAPLEDTVDRQLRLLSWFFDRYHRLLPLAQIIRYEDLVASRGTALSRIVPAAAGLDEALETKNRNTAYDPRVLRKLADRLLASDGGYWHFYTRDSVRRILDPESPSPKTCAM